MKFLLLTEDPHPIVYYSYAQRPWGAVVHVSVSGRQRRACASFVLPLKHSIRPPFTVSFWALFMRAAERYVLRSPADASATVHDP